jgi:hypothetical protein
MKFSFDIHYSLFDILRFKKSSQMQRVTNMRDKLSEVLQPLLDTYSSRETGN